MTKNRYTAAILLIALILSFAREADHRRDNARHERVIARHERTIKAEKLTAVRFEIKVHELKWKVAGLKAAAKHTDKAIMVRMRRILEQDLETLEGETDE